MRVRRCRPLLGTFVEMAVDAADEPAAVQAMNEAFDAMATVDALMSFHRKDSDLSLVNRAPAGTVLALHSWTTEVLALAKELCEATSGAFDCAVGSRLAAWGLLPETMIRSSAAGTVDGSVLDVDVLDRGVVRVRRPVCLDLGGIAKGFAVDKAIESLDGEGLSSALVNAGGDLRIMGSSPWPIHLRRPGTPNQLIYAGSLSDGALATSAPYFSMPASRDGKNSALLDPRDGRNIVAMSSFTVIAPRCAVADGLAKALAVDGTLAIECARQYQARAFVL